MEGRWRSGRVLIVDDEPGVRESLRMVLKEQYEAVLANSGEEALEMLAQVRPDLVLLDVLMPGIDGLVVLERIKEQDPRVPVLMLTATKTVKTAVTAMKLGAFDYVTKPFDVEELLIIVERATRDAARDAELENLRWEVGRRYSPDNIIGNSPRMQKIFRTIGMVAPLKTTVLITGESGTGKELIAKALHYQSPRADKPLVTLNCAAIPENLLESELFGHERGAFTDAVTREARAVRARGPRHDLSRRDRRDRAVAAGEAAARARAGRVHARRRQAEHPRRRPHHRRHQSRPRASDARGRLSRGPLLPAERRLVAPAAAARAPRGSARS